MERVKTVTKKLLEETQKADERALDLEAQVEDIKQKLEECENEKKELLESCAQRDDELENVVRENEEEINKLKDMEYAIEGNIRIIDANKNELHNLEQERKHKEDKHAELDAKLNAFIQECMDMSE